MGRKASRQRGQSVVEFALILPVLAVMLSALLEFGLAMDSDMALEAASREGARAGASLGNGGTQGGCPNSLVDDPATGVDATIVRTVQTSLSGAGVDLRSVTIWIYGTNSSGNANTSIDKYAWAAGSFTSSNGHPYAACGRHDGTFGGGNYDSIAVQIQYTYTSRTGLLALFTGGLPMTAKAVMPIGPPWKLL